MAPRRRRQEIEHEEEEPQRRPRPPPGTGSGGKPSSDNFVDLLNHDENEDGEDAFALPGGSAATGPGNRATGKAWAAGDGGRGRSGGARSHGDDDSDDDLLL